MITLYFSGTGNTKYVADFFSKKNNSSCFSIEDNLDFGELILNEETIAFVYPIYGSCVPLIMRNFIAKHKEKLSGKNLIILVTQNVFSGDGARTLTDHLKGIKYNVIYAEHFNMPNNICNAVFYPLSSSKKAKKYVFDAHKKIELITHNLSNGIVEKRGFNLFSKYLGLLSQRLYFRFIEKKAMRDVRINENCINCSLCTEVCPMNNLEEKDGKIVQKMNCTLCYRCVNVCPMKAITVMLHKEVKAQYEGIDKIIISKGKTE